MADTSKVDLVSLIEQNTPTRFSKAVGTGSKRTRKGACPWCGGTDRFAVLVNEIPQHYHCGIHQGAGCGAHGDAITFLREWLSCGYIEACEELGVDPGSEYDGVKCRKDVKDMPPSDIWQKAAIEFCMQARKHLQSKTGQRAREWLYSRGLTDKTINDAGLGLNEVQSYQKADVWGTEDNVWVARGIVIPYRVEGNLWRVEVRRSDKDIAADKARGRAKPPKYVGITGGSNGLYGVDTLLPDVPLVLCESAFCAMSFKQVVGSRASVLATGSTGASRGARWIDLIKKSPIILGAFDYDVNQAGDKAFNYWHETVGAIRVTPWGHDINDMLQAGIDINEWLDAGLELATIVQVPANVISLPMAETTVTSDGEIDDEHCADCHISIDAAENFFYDDNGVGYCTRCRAMPNAENDINPKAEDVAEPPANPLEYPVIVEAVKLFGGKAELLDCTAAEYIAGESLRIQRANNSHLLAKVTNTPECLHYVPRSENKGHCKGKPVHDGWCELHAHGSEVMKLGQSCDFVAIQINESLSIGEGIYGWLAYAEISVPERLKEIRRAIHRRTAALKIA